MTSYENIVLILSFSYCVCFSIYKIVDGEYSTDDYNSSRITIGAIMKNSQMLKLIPNYFKNKTMYKHAVKKLSFVIKCVLDRYKTQQMCDKAALENGGTLKSVPYQYNPQELCDKAVRNYAHTL